MGVPSPATVKRMKNTYPAGSIVVLDSMSDAQAPQAGSKGTVLCVDDIGTVHVRWENGSCLGLVYGEDKFHLENGE